MAAGALGIPCRRDVIGLGRRPRVTCWRHVAARTQCCAAVIHRRWLPGRTDGMASTTSGAGHWRSSMGNRLTSSRSPVMTGRAIGCHCHPSVLERGWQPS